LPFGHYFGEAARAHIRRALCDTKGLGRLYGGILSTMLITQHGFPFAITIAR